MAVTARRRRFTLDEYHRMGEAGILHEDSRVELIEGEIIEMTPIGSRHAATVARIHSFFATRLGNRVNVWGQGPLILRHHASEPQPDVLLLAPRPDFYASALPEPSDVRLLIEVAETSLLYDRRTKFPLYARAGVAEAWLVDVDSVRVEIHRTAGMGGYEHVHSPGRAETFACIAYPDLAVTVADLLG